MRDGAGSFECSNLLFLVRRPKIARKPYGVSGFNSECQSEGCFAGENGINVI